MGDLDDTAEGDTVTVGGVIACSAILALAFLPLALIPWGVQAPAMVIATFGLALMGKDGVFALFGYGLVAATVSMAVRHPARRVTPA